jgi:hypothetical protein
MRPVAHLWQAGAHRWVGNWFSGKQTLGGEVWLLGLKAALQFRVVILNR